MLTIATVKNSKLNNYCTSCCTVKFYFFLGWKLECFHQHCLGRIWLIFKSWCMKHTFFLSELLTFKTSRALKVTFIVYAQKYIVNELNKSNKTVNLLTWISCRGEQSKYNPCRVTADFPEDNIGNNNSLIYSTRKYTKLWLKFMDKTENTVFFCLLLDRSQVRGKSSTKILDVLCRNVQNLPSVGFL